MFWNQLLGPFIYNCTLNGKCYLWILKSTFMEYLKDISLVQIQKNWFHYVVASPHNRIIVGDLLNESFPNKWIGNIGVVFLPEGCPDLSPLDYFSLKDRIFRNEFKDIDNLRNSVLHEFSKITTGRAASSDTLYEL